jgi:hypothetical protein
VKTPMLLLSRLRQLSPCLISFAEVTVLMMVTTLRRFAASRAASIVGAMTIASVACSENLPEQRSGIVQIEIPESMRQEHEQIHGALVAASEQPGAVGEAARALTGVLHPHFVREEQIALPPLGLLESLARGEYEPWMRDVLPMTDSLQAEWSQMLREHEVIAAAAVRLEEVARAEGDAEVERLARTLQLHARTEEEVYYPAAVLVGIVVRMNEDRRQ